MLEPCQRCFYTIMANYNGSLEAVDCHVFSVRYDMAVKRELAASQVPSSGHLRCCSDADTSNKCLSREKDASILSWPTVMGHFTRSCCLPYSQREIRYGRQQRSWRSSQKDSSGHLQRCSDADTANQYLSNEKDASILSWPTTTGH